jgi:sulfoxide reductase heme-binding subunit YedZ
VPAATTLGLLPLAAIVVRAASGKLGPDPIVAATNALGHAAIVLLMASLALTPIRLVTRWSWPIRIRRTLGVLAFVYAAAHLITYGVVGKGLAVGAIVEDVLRRPFILAGLAAFAVLLPLAVTSTDGMVRRLGFARWKRLHRLAYVAGALAAVHFILGKPRSNEPIGWAAFLGLGLAIRIVAGIRRRRGGQRSPATPAEVTASRSG